MYGLNIYLQKKKVNPIKCGGLQGQQLTHHLTLQRGRLWIPKMSVKTTSWEGKGGEEMGQD